MARSRNIKPAFFKNDELAEHNTPLGRLLFIGLWSIADYKGNLEYRAKKIKAEVLPYDDCDIDQLIADLRSSGFISIYTEHEPNLSNGEKTYIHIPNFIAHQAPHKNERERGTKIPVFKSNHVVSLDVSASQKKPEEIQNDLDLDGSDPAVSCFLNPDSSTKDLVRSDNGLQDVDGFFELFWEAGMRKEKKKTCRPIFKKVITKAVKESCVTAGQATQMLIDDIKARIDAGVNGFDLMHPTTYLNQERWNDEIINQNTTSNSGARTSPSQAVANAIAQSNSRR